jgi:hypothetical protein
MEIREFDVIKVGDPLSVLLTCFDKEQGGYGARMCLPRRGTSLRFTAIRLASSDALMNATRTGGTASARFRPRAVPPTP